MVVITCKDPFLHSSLARCKVVNLARSIEPMLTSLFGSGYAHSLGQGGHFYMSIGDVEPSDVEPSGHKASHLRVGQEAHMLHLQSFLSVCKACLHCQSPETTTFADP